MRQYTGDRLRIAFIIPSLHTGGSERVILHLVRNLDRTKFEILLLVLKKEGALLSFIPDDVECTYLNHSRTLFSIFSILSFTRKRSPDILFSTLGHVNLLVALLKPLFPIRTILVARESSIVSIRNKDERYPALFDFLFRTVYKRFHGIICQSNYMKDDLVDRFSIPGNKITVINNPVDFALLPSFSEANRGRPRVQLISIGQLRPEKGYTRVIASLSKCPLDFDYRIIGEGTERQSLEEQINRLGLTENVTLMGQMTNPYQVLMDSDCLLVGSFYEGFPNVVLEAHACGVPVIAFDAPGGHNEIINNGMNGWFVKTPEAFCELLLTKAYATVDRQKIISTTKTKYGLGRIMNEYQTTLMTIHRAHAKS